MIANPTLFVTLMYLFVSGLGLIYEFILFSAFGVNILDYSEAADFFLAAFKHPEALLSSFAIAGTFVFYRFLANFARQRKNAVVRGLLYFWVWIGLFRREILIPLGIFYFLFFYAIAAEAEASRIVFNSQDAVKVFTRFGDNKEIQIIPIGTTEKFIFGVRKSDQLGEKLPVSGGHSIVAVPFSNITNLEYVN